MKKLLATTALAAATFGAYACSNEEAAPSPTPVQPPKIEVATVQQRVVAASCPVLQDTSIFSDVTSNANGAGPTLQVRYAVGAIRRALVKFNLAACTPSIPSGATITAATLSLYMNRASTLGTGNPTIGIHRVTQSWGTATSNAGTGAATSGLGGGVGILAVSGDATWSHRFYSGTSWTTAGGTYTGTASKSVVVNTTVGTKTWSGSGTSDSMVQDVQAWVNNSANNHGWILVATTAIESAGRGFDSSEGATDPALSVSFTIPYGYTDCSTDSDCTSTGQCVSQDIATIGQACSGCTTGVCCSSNTCQSAPQCKRFSGCNTSTGACLYNTNLTGTSCNDGNACTHTDTCSTGTCSGTAYSCAACETCNGSGGCTLNAGFCKISGTCYASGTDNPGNECQECVPGTSTSSWTNKSAGSSCGSAVDNDCTNPDTCNGSGTCSANNETNGTACTDDGNQCTNDQCSSGSCTHPNKSNGSGCDDGVFCNGADSCTSGACSSHAGNPCTGGSECADSCNEVADNCFDTAGTACTDDGNQCTNDQCNGAGSCAHPNKSNGTSCSDGLYCNGTDTCNGSGACSNHTGNPCTGGSVCADSCNETADNCFDLAGASCTSDGNPCTLDECNGSGTCAHPAGNSGTQCRAPSCSGGVATVAEVCTGSSATCPGPNNVACSGTCVGTSCGDCTSDGDCGAGRFCESGSCFDKKANGATCGGANQCTSGNCVDGYCCNGACSGGTSDCQACNVAGKLGQCVPRPNGDVCRPAQGECDVADTCNGSATTCTDSKRSNGFACGDDGNDCTNDTCNGSANSCQHPNKANGSSCADDGNVCTADQCQSGSCSHPAGNAGTVCRVANGSACDQEDTCTGSSTSCPDTKKPSGTACADDGNECTNDRCNGTSDTCQHPNKANGTSCTDDGNVCTVDTCQSGTCSHPAGNSGTVCRAANGVCDVAETCNGTSASCPNNGYKASSSQCRAQSCTSGTATLSANCTGSGPNCPALQTEACFPFVCAGNACDTNCSVDGDCAADGYCDGSACQPKGDNGAVCSVNKQCLSNRCVDGFCCDAGCAGQCEACDIAGLEGTCAAVTGLPHGARTACVGDGTACDGFCDGLKRNACTYPDASVQCRAPSCTARVETHAASCNGTGTCPSVVTEDCGEYVCDATACFDSCLVDAFCVPTSYCAGSECTPKGDDGQSCTNDAECSSGHCVDGYCCDSLCTNQCEACDVVGREGICSPAFGAPHGSRPACVSDSSVCGGACDGTVTTACSYPGPGTVCREADCSNGVATVAASCTGVGQCPPEFEQDCDPFSCGTEGRCDGDCVVDSDCGANAYCAAGVCSPLGDNGDPCPNNNACKSGLCVDAVCCSTECSGQCEACNVEGRLGECVPVTGAPHGTRPQCTSDDSACAGSCDGAQRDGCTYPDEETQCRAPTCSGGVATLAGRCTGSGRCPPRQRQACAPFSCSGQRCNGNCTSDIDCGLGTFCSGGVCSAVLGPGVPCGGDLQCASGLCVDGVCCDGECNGRCEACDVTGSEGTCTNVGSGLPHGGRPSCAGVGVCASQCTDSSDVQCTFPSAATFCGGGSCSSGVQTNPATCNGAGTCLVPTTRDCAPYACGSLSCNTTCVDDLDCAEEFVCIGNLCVTAPPDAGAPDAAPDAAPDGGGLVDASTNPEPDAAAGAGGSMGAGGASGTGGRPINGSSGSVAMNPDAGDAAADASDAGDAGMRQVRDTGTCGCRTPGSPGRGPIPWLVLASAVAALTYRRRDGVRRAR